ncbi:hypothetical protein CE91St46_01580 [Eubacteriales bacterium]|nr:hypothetical protein [Oscillospiraceae bacterium]MBS1380710.1 hypothetical protein [Oscillospiraceae bacterium]GKH49047.1 hypothetical protein CE91St46_01580 [Eubacteriales bacterium]GKH61688.1 hypothetical protein CE91St47_01570 [Eubacteriales bacterium]
MVKITQEQIDYLTPLMPNLQELIEQDSDDALLENLDFLIIDELDETQNNLSPKGVKLQKIYDDIFHQND